MRDDYQNPLAATAYSVTYGTAGVDETSSASASAGTMIDSAHASCRYPPVDTGFITELLEQLITRTTVGCYLDSRLPFEGVFAGDVRKGEETGTLWFTGILDDGMQSVEIAIPLVGDRILFSALLGTHTFTVAEGLSGESVPLTAWFTLGPEASCLVESIR